METILTLNAHYSERYGWTLKKEENTEDCKNCGHGCHCSDGSSCQSCDCKNCQHTVD